MNAITENMTSKGYMRANEVAATIGYQRSTVTRWVAEGKVEHRRVGAELWVLVASVRSLLGSAGAELFPPKANS